MTFEPGDLEAAATIRIEETRDPTLAWRRTPSYQITTDRDVLSDPITLSLAFDPAPDKRLVLAEVSGSIPKPIRNAHLDHPTNTFTTELDELGTFAIAAESIVSTTGPSGCAVDGSNAFNNISITPCYIQELEPNDTSSTAQAVLDTLDTGVDVSAIFDGQNDNYRLTIPQGTWGSLSVHSFTEIDDYASCIRGLELSLTLLDEQGRVIVTNGLYDCPTFTIRVHGPVPAGGQVPYHLAIDLLSPQAAPYHEHGPIEPRDSGF